MGISFRHLDRAVSQDVPHFHQRPTFHDHPRRTGVVKGVGDVILDIRSFTGRHERTFDTGDSPSFPTGGWNSQTPTDYRDNALSGVIEAG